MHASTDMGAQRSVALEIRTIVVTTRAAVRRHRQMGHADLVPISVERGLLLLEEQRARRPGDGVSAEPAYDDARREIESLVGDADPSPALSRPE